MSTSSVPESIAIVGMAGRFPQAATLEEFWSNLRAGREAVTFFAPDDVEWLPVEHPPRANDPHFVRARAVLDRPEWFDAAFFRLNPQEAAIMDPQQRVFLECAWEALENAGCNPDARDGTIGVFAGAGFNSYLFNNLLTNRSLIADYGLFPVLTMNEKDYLATRVAYKLNLRGPALNVQTACSTSLVAVALACQHLLDCHCDVALAGGVSITFPANRGHQHVEGGIMSQDGHCRAFDAKATGTVVGNGAGVVVLKRLSEAVAAGDRICAVIKGFAVNNDGAVKMGFTAPSIDGQAECIATAQAMAGFDPRSIGYVEAHGTGTPLGDPIEMAALAKAFGGAAKNGGRCAVGSLKTNVGHLDVAAGVAGLIKTTLALQHGEIPPTLHFEKLNPEIAGAEGRFSFNPRLQPWPRGATPRRAGVSSFGIGGTNVHVVLEEAPTAAPATPGGGPQLLCLSARTPVALQAATENLAAHLERHPELDLADVAFTLRTGRRAFEHRRAVVARDLADAITTLRTAGSGRVIDRRPEDPDGRVVFMFAGQGDQAVNMARELQATEPDFRRHVDEACEIANPKLGLDLRDILFPDEAGAAAAAERLGETRLAQPALFVIEHALARLWMQWGVQPSAMIGHSLGEYVAAQLAGVFTLEDALTIVVERARLMQAQPRGAMLALRLSEARAAEHVAPPLALAAVNAPSLCVVSGPCDAVGRLEQTLAARGIPAKRLATSHAFHSPMMEPVLPPLAKVFRRVALRPPTLPFVSNVTGTWITAAQATSPEYWCSHVRGTVRFADGIGEIIRAGHKVLLETGPGHTLAALARQHPGAAPLIISASLGQRGESRSDRVALLHALGELWVAGTTPRGTNGFSPHERRRIVALPTYPFERKRCWIEPGSDWRTESPAPVTSGGARPPRPTASEAAPRAGAVSAGAAAPACLPMLKQIFQELSGLDLASTAPEATFNQLGFDSLFLTQACVAVGRRFGVALAYRQLRDELGSFRALAGYVERHGMFAGSGVTVSVSDTVPAPAAPSQRIEVTDAQRELWMASQLGPAAALAYHESALMHLDGPLQIDALRRALDRLVARHESLRTTFAPAGDFQIIEAAGSAVLAFEDFSGPHRSAETAADAPAQRWLDEAFHRPFDLVRGPLFRPVLARIDGQRHVLALIVHHIVCDGWSLGILVRELAELYASETAGRPARLPAAPLFSACAAGVSREQRAAAFAAAEAYWRGHFAGGVPGLELPVDRPRPPDRSYAGGFASRTLSSALTAPFKQFCAAHECTVFTASLAVFNVLLHQITGQRDLVVGVPVAGQALDNHPELVGHLANLLPIRSRIADDVRFGDYLSAVDRTMSSALAHGGYPFGRLLRLLKLRRDSSRVALTPVLFNTVHHRGRMSFADVTATLAVQPKRFVNFDLNFNFALTGDSFTLGCYYSAELFNAATVQGWLDRFEALAETLLANPAARVADAALPAGLPSSRAMTRALEAATAI